MDNRTIRYNNVRYLVDLIGGVSNFAEKIGKGQSQVSQFAGTNPIKGIGNKIAREIEAALQKDHGWLDVAHPELWESHGDMRPTQSQRMGDMVQSQGGEWQSQGNNFNDSPELQKLIELLREKNPSRDVLKHLEQTLELVTKAQESKDQVANGTAPDTKTA